MEDSNPRRRKERALYLDMRRLFILLNRLPWVEMQNFEHVTFIHGAGLQIRAAFLFDTTFVKDPGGWTRLARAATAQGHSFKSTQVSRIIIHTFGV